MLLAAIELAFLVPYVFSFNAIFSQTLRGVPSSTATTGFLVGIEVLPICNNVLKLFLDFYAVGWVGMWLALTLRKPNLAAAFTVLFVLVLPSFVFCVPDFLIDIGFIVWARGKLRQDFRALAVQSQSTMPAVLVARPAPETFPTPGVK